MPYVYSYVYTTVNKHGLRYGSVRIANFPPGGARL